MPSTFADRDGTATAAAGPERAVAIDIITDPDALGTIVPAWRDLVEAGAGAVSVFQTPEWILPAVSRLSGARRPAIRLAVVSDAQGVALVAPLEVETTGGVRILKWLGDPLFEYGDVVVRRDVDAGVLVAAVVTRLRRDERIDLVHLRKVRRDAAVAAYLDSSATPLPGAVRAPFADLGCSAAGEAAARTTKADRRKRRRLADFGALAFTVHRSGETAERHVRTAIALKRAWLDSRGLISRTLADDACVDALVNAVGADGSGACVSAFTIDGEPIAVEIGFIRHRTYYSYLAAIEPRFARYSPGRLQLAETIAWCRDNGVERFDLLGTDGEYKERVASGSVAVADWIVPLSLRGTLYGRLVLGILRPAAKAVFGLAPVRARIALKRVAAEGTAGRGLVAVGAAGLLGLAVALAE